MYCKNCGNKVNENQKFCPMCGEKSLDIKQLYILLNNNREYLTSDEIYVLIKDFENKSTAKIELNNPGNYVISFNDDAKFNGVLVYKPKEHRVQDFKVGQPKGKTVVYQIENNSKIITVNAEIAEYTPTNNSDIITDFNFKENKKNEPINICKHCGNEINENSKFCKYCGKEMVFKTDEKEATEHIDKYSQESTGGSFYIIDFFKNIIRKNNIGVIIWLIINTILVTFLIGYILTMSYYEMQTNPVAAYFIGFIVYLISIVISLSPIGEFILRLQASCKEIKRKDYLDRLNPLFDEVCQKSKKRSPNLPDDIKFFMSKDEEPNAFATGRKTICLTEGILNYSDEEIKAILAHEFGHLAHKDTDAILVVEVGNLIVTGIFVAFRLLVKVVTLIFHLMFSIVSDSFAEIFVSAVSRVLIDLLLVLIMNIWTRLGTLICLHSTRKNEFAADEYSCSMGYGKMLCGVLDKLDSERSGKNTLWAALNSTHPDTDVRIAKMQELGVEYSK